MVTSGKEPDLRRPPLWAATEDEGDAVPFEDPEERQQRERLARVRERRQQHQRETKFWLALGAVALICFALFLRSLGPQTPRLQVKWSGFKGSRVLTSGSLVDASPAALVVTLENAKSWQVAVDSVDAVQHDQKVTWLPTGASTLRLGCDPVPQGIQGFWGWLWPGREATLRAVVSRRVAPRRFGFPDTKQTVWIAPRIRVLPGSQYDQPAIEMLSVLGRDWAIVRSFDGQAAQESSGTYASLNVATLKQQTLESASQAMIDTARKIARRKPNTGIKFIVRDDGKRVRAVLRLSFDGKKARGGWIKTRDQKEASPVFWWEDLQDESLDLSTRITPSLPR
jgi:hypothetical protein